jgi:hypothetical protein
MNVLVLEVTVDIGHYFRGGEPVTIQETALKALLLFFIKMRKRAKGSKTGKSRSYRNGMSRKERRARSKMMQCVKFQWSALDNSGVQF